MVQGAPKRAVEAATRIAPEVTSRSQLQRTTSPNNSKSQPTRQLTLISDTRSSHQASPAVIRKAPGKAPSRHARTTRALSTPPSSARRLSAMNSTAVSRSRTPQSAKPGQPKPGVKFSKVNRVQSEDGEEEDDDSCIVSEVSNDRPPKSILWKDRPKSKKVSKIRTVSTMHRTTKVEPPTKDTTGNAAPQANDGDTEVAAEGEQIKSRPRNLQYRQVGDRDDHSHMDRECQASGHTVAHPGTTLAVKSMRSVPSTTIRRTQRQHQMLRIIRLPALARTSKRCRKSQAKSEAQSDDEPPRTRQGRRVLRRRQRASDQWQDELRSKEL